VDGGLAGGGGAAGGGAAAPALAGAAAECRNAPPQLGPCRPRAEWCIVARLRRRRAATAR
jgi:hypothetical protein